MDGSERKAEKILSKNVLRRGSKRESTVRIRVNDMCPSHFELIAALMFLEWHAPDKTSRDMFHVRRRYPNESSLVEEESFQILKQVIDIDRITIT